jgi:nucleotide-binding universal stress UspA family protein
MVSSEDPAKRSSEIAANDVDLLILALPTHRSVWHPALLQHVSAKLLQDGACPVLIIPSGVRPPFLNVRR